jgi:hypothetical protein
MAQPLDDPLARPGAQLNLGDGGGVTRIGAAGEQEARPHAASARAASTNSPMPLSHSMRDASRTRRSPSARSVSGGVNCVMSTPAPLMSRERSASLAPSSIRSLRSSGFCTMTMPRGCDSATR